MLLSQSEPQPLEWLEWKSRAFCSSYPLGIGPLGFRQLDVLVLPFWSLYVYAEALLYHSIVVLALALGCGGPSPSLLRSASCNRLFIGSFFI